MFAEEHDRQGNYFWLFSGNNQGVGFKDVVSASKFAAANLGEALIAKGFTFNGYSQSLPAIGSDVHVTPLGLCLPLPLRPQARSVDQLCKCPGRSHGRDLGESAV
jgi:hypothetical protein